MHSEHLFSKSIDTKIGYRSTIEVNARRRKFIFWTTCEGRRRFFHHSF
ncbi:unnamed protein product [Larinioides sclopetarius]|uniref:Uncharacterized protein n=1 Tax=Larinioides sclopetarius TaxID=280406 RepID=A0AAV2AAT2_9ARAC